MLPLTAHRPGVFAITCAIVASGALAANGAAGTPPAPTPPPAVAGLAPATQDVVRVKGGLEAVVATVDTVRAGGVGVATVHVAQRTDPGIDARAVRVNIRGRGGVMPTGAGGSGWACRASQGAIDCSRSRIGRSQSSPVIRVALKGTPGMRDGAMPLRVEVTWKERTRARRSGGRTSGTQRAMAGRSDVTNADVQTDSRLSVTVRAPGPMIALARDGDASHLQASITGIDGTTASIHWRQACLTAGEASANPACGGRVAPRARFISPQHQDDAADTEVAVVEPPMTDAPVRLVFEATVREGGAVAVGRTTVTTTPVVAPTYDPRIDTLEELKSVRPVEPTPVAVAPTALVRGSVGGTGPTRLVPGRPATITARVPGRSVTRVSWRVVGDGRTLLAGASRTGTSLRVTAPPRLAGAVITLVATASLADGTTVELPELVTVTAPPRAGPSARPSEPMRRATEASLDRTAALGRMAAMSRAHESRGPDGTVCDIADRVQRGAVQPVPTDPNGARIGYPDMPPDDTPPPDIQLAETGLLWLGTATATRSGTTCSIAFEGGELHYGEYVFVRVSGRITRDGLRILGGAFNPPEKWLRESGALRDALTQAANNVLRFSVPEDSAVRLGASIDSSGDWRDLSGELTIDAGLSLLPLPSGWRFRPARLDLDVNGVMALTIEAVAPEGQSGSVSIRGSAGGGGSMSLDVEAAGLVVMQQVVTDPATGKAEVDPATGKARMSQVTANFGGDFDMNSWDRADAPSSTPVGFGLTTTIRGSLENLVLAANFTVERIGFEWTPGSISADARVRVGRGPQPTAMLAGGGTYRGADDWSVRISTRLGWQVTRQLQIDSLDGTMERKGGRTTISARGAASGWPGASAFEFDSITAELTNACPVPAVEGRPCTDATAHVELDARGRVVLPQFTSGADEKMPWNATASIDLQTRIFTLTGGLSSASGIGPAELKLTGIALQLSNDTSKQWCTQPGADASAKGDVRMGIAATGEVFGKKVEFAGEFGGKAGLCLIGRMGDMPSDVPQASLFREVEVAYTSQKVLVNLPGGGPRLSNERQVSVYADFTLPSGVERAASGTHYLLGTLGLADRSIIATVGVQYPNDGRKIIAGSPTGSHLALSGLQFSFIWTRTDLAASATALMDYETAANAGSGIGGSSTPLAGTLMFDLRRATFSVEARVDSQRAPGGEVANAFGVQDLRVRQLGIRGSVGGNTSISFTAGVSLPTRWVGPIGLKSGTQQVLDFSISQVEPCMRVALRRPPGDDTGVAVDLANVGLITAHEVGLTIAPLGCSLPGNQYVEPGFAFVFDGYLAGVFRVNINARVSLPTPSNARLAVFTHAEIGALNLGGVASFDKTTLDIDIDTAASRYKVGFSGGLDIIGNRVEMSVALAAENGRVDFKAHAGQDLNVVGFGFKGTQDLQFAVNRGALEKFMIHANLDARVLGVSLARARVDFDYDDGVVQKWGFSVGATIPLIIASAGGDVSFDYALYRAPGREATKDPFVRKTFDIGMGGRLRFLFWSTSFHWTIFRYNGALQGTGREGVNSNVEEKQKEPAPPALPQVGWTWMQGDEGWRTRMAVNTVTYKVRYTTTSEGSDAPQMLVRGGIDITACEVSTATGTCVQGRDVTKDPKFTGRIDGLGRKIIIENAQADCSAPIRGYCRNWRDVVLEGDDWRAMVQWIEAARRTYADLPDNKAAGKILPPIKHWTVTPIDTSLAWADYGGSRVAVKWGFTRGVSDSIRPTAEVLPPIGTFGNRLGVAMANGKPGLFRLNESPVLPGDGAPARSVPVTADWDGDGADGLSVWFGRSSTAAGSNAGGLWLRRHDGGQLEATDDPTPCPAFCQPVEPPGTPAYGLLQPDDQQGRRGAAFPVAGNWDGYEKDGSAADTIGLATYRDGTMDWVLRPATGAPMKVRFGARVDRMGVPRPVVGDWNGDGTTDIGVYDPPSAPGDTGRLRPGQFRLLTSLNYGSDPQSERTPDLVISMGSYGSRPVAGDWNNDQITDIGTVAPAGPDGRATWRLRYMRSESCTASCAPDQVITTPGGDIVPLAGRWR